MIDHEALESLLHTYSPAEIETRLNNIFNGYLGSDTGDCPEELQLNHKLILLMIQVVKNEKS